MAAGICDESFRANVELCIQHVEDFLTFKPEKVTIFSDADAAEVVCRQGLVNGSTACLEVQYAQCPRVAVFRTQCGFQTLEPDLMRKHNDVVCNKLQALQRDMTCLLERQCAMESCMANFDQLNPSGLSAGMWKTPKHSGICRLYSYTWHCLEKSIVSECHQDSEAVLLDLMRLYRPPSCTEDEVEEWKKKFRSLSAIANTCVPSPTYISGLSVLLCFLLWRPTF
ncbi:uncharacterized protein LOC112572314 [Pomacea canaliculata]|nr:uncharacterized protein LOC112572314 [Pomacea canaliculata]